MWKQPAFFFAAILSSTLFQSCSSSSFTGNSGQKAGATSGPSPNATAASSGTPQNNSNPNPAPPGTPTPSPTPVTAANPCAGQPAVAAAPSHSMLFYAPADYSGGTGGPEGNTNVFVNGVQQGFASAGYQVQVVSNVGNGPLDFNGCTLFKSYRQIWLWLPCNSAQNMDSGSFAAVQKFYNGGGGIVLLTDNHYYSQGNANTHCDASNWAGSGGTPSDAVNFAQALGFNLAYGSLGGFNGMAGGGGSYGSGASPALTPATSPSALAQTFSSLNWWPAWPNLTISQMPSTATALPMSAGGGFAGLGTAGSASSNYAALLQTPASGTSPTLLAAVITPLYIFHSPPQGDDVAGLQAVADYIDANTAPTTAPSAALALTSLPAPIVYQAESLKVALPQQSTDELRTLLSSTVKEDVAYSLRSLAQRGVLGVDEVMTYMDHPEYLVRMNAAMAAAYLPRAAMLAKLQTALQTPGNGANLTISLARSLAALHATEATASLQQALASTTDSVARSELALAIGTVTGH